LNNSLENRLVASARQAYCLRAITGPDVSLLLGVEITLIVQLSLLSNLVEQVEVETANGAVTDIAFAATGGFERNGPLTEVTRRPPPRGEEKAAQASGGFGVLGREWRQSPGSMGLTLKRTADNRVRVHLNG